MKKSKSFVVAGLIICAFSTVGKAQDFWKTDPSSNKILVDTTYINAAEVTFEPGKKTNMHTHSAFFAYVLEGGKLFVEYADGHTETIELKSGEYAYGGPDRPHTTVNVGNEPIKILMVELKEHPYLKPEKTKRKN